MTKKLKDSIHQMLQACYNGNAISSVCKSFIKENKQELYNTEVWRAVIDKVNKCFERHNKKKGAKLSLGNNPSTLFLALGFLNAGDEQCFNIEVNQYFEANNIK